MGEEKRQKITSSTKKKLGLFIYRNYYFVVLLFYLNMMINIEYI